MTETNPLLSPWTTPFGLPPFADIRPDHILPAFAAAFATHEGEIAAIAADTSPPTFANTVDAMERSGRALERVAAVFWNLASADTNAALQTIEREIAPRSTKHFSDIYMNAALWRRFAVLWESRETLGLDPEQLRVLDRYRRAFQRAGVDLPEAKKARLAEILQRLSTLGTQFSQNVLADESAYLLVLDKAEDLAGLPPFLVDAMARAAADRGHPGKHGVTLSRSIIEPFLTFSTRRDLRKTAFEAWVKRGEGGGATDNRAIVAEMVALRRERANLLGFATFAHFKLDDTMARTPERVRDLLDAVWPPAKARAAAERAEQEALWHAEGGSGPIEAWDWRHFSEKVRRARYAIDEAELKPYLPLDGIIAAAFDVAGRLFGLTFKERPEVSAYHPKVRAFEVSGAGGEHIGLFLGDYFARASKRSGAWMSSYRAQRKLGEAVRPIIVNVMNFAEPPESRPALLSFDDARTLFHEFGHALHGLLSDVTYPRLAGTAVATDFVELPSQLFEHWLEQPDVLRRFARHADTGEPIPDALIDKLKRARTFNQGFATVEYAASAIVDLELHLATDLDGFDATAFERQVLVGIGMPDAIVMRHRIPHFAHVFAGDHYSAGYYSYLWSEVLDADAFRAFLETGDAFDKATAGRLKTFVYAAGNTRPPDEAYIAFRGRLPTVGPLLEKRGLA